MKSLEIFEKVSLNNLKVITGGDIDTPCGTHTYPDGQTASWSGDCHNADGSYSYYNLVYYIAKWRITMVNQFKRQFLYRGIASLYILFLLACRHSAAIDSSVYLQLINQAELHLLCNELDQALKIYERGFNNKSVPFAADLYNYMQVSIASNNRSKAKFAIIELVRHKGVTYKYILTHQNFELFRSYFSQELGTNLKEDILNAEKDFKQSKNAELISEVSNILHTDQQVRGLKIDGEYADPYMLIQDSINFTRMMNIFSRYGYPGEDLVGVCIDEDDPYSLFISDYLGTVIRHQFGNKNYDPTFIDYLKEFIRQGVLSPDVLSTNLSVVLGKGYNFNSKSDLPGDGAITVIDNIAYRQELSEDDLNTIDSLREIYHLEPFRENMCKALFSFRKYKEYKLSILPQVSIYHMKYKEQAQNLIKDFGLIPIKETDCDCLTL